MSVLEFVAAWKWPVVVLVALLYSRWALRKNPSLTAWLKKLVEKRDVTAELGPAKLQLSTPATQADVLTAAASDEELKDAALEELAAQPGGDVDFDGLDLAGVRQSAIEAIMRDAARWGWEMAQIGFRTPPEPQIIWDRDGQPRIIFGRGSGIAPTQSGGKLDAVEARHRPDLYEAVRRRLEEMNRDHGGR